MEQKIKLDYTLQTPEERLELVNKIVENTPQEELSEKYLETLADYLVYAIDKEERKEKHIITPNRAITINKREVSLDGMVTRFENSNAGSSSEASFEDNIFNLAINDKNVLLTPKIGITEDDIKDVPGLKELRAEIARLEELLPTASGKTKFSIKQNIIDLRKDQYVLKMSYKKPIYCTNFTKSARTLSIYENVKIENDEVIVEDANISLFIPQHISFLLCNYSKLKQEAHSQFESDIYYLMLSLEDLAEKALEKNPMYKDVMIYKIDGDQNLDIQRKIEMKHNHRYSVEYISSIWRKKIPNLIAEQAKKEYITWYYTEKEKGAWKRCSRCGQVKLIHPYFFSKNKSSKDGFYSICKECRNKKG